MQNSSQPFSNPRLAHQQWLDGRAAKDAANKKKQAGIHAAHNENHKELGKILYEQGEKALAKHLIDTNQSTNTANRIHEGHQFAGTFAEAKADWEQQQALMDKGRAKASGGVTYGNGKTLGQMSASYSSAPNPYKFVEYANQYAKEAKETNSFENQANPAVKANSFESKPSKAGTVESYQKQPEFIGYIPRWARSSSDNSDSQKNQSTQNASKSSIREKAVEKAKTYQTYSKPTYQFNSGNQVEDAYSLNLGNRT